MSTLTGTGAFAAAMTFFFGACLWPFLEIMDVSMTQRLLCLPPCVASTLVFTIIFNTTGVFAFSDIVDHSYTLSGVQFSILNWCAGVMIVAGLLVLSKLKLSWNLYQGDVIKPFGSHFHARLATTN